MTIIDSNPRLAMPSEILTSDFYVQSYRWMILMHGVGLTRRGSMKTYSIDIQRHCTVVFLSNFSKWLLLEIHRILNQCGVPVPFRALHYTLITLFLTYCQKIV